MGRLMRVIEHEGEVEIIAADDFDLVKTLECGQCFRWNADENGVYTGVAMGRAARMYRSGSSVFISGTLEDFEAIWRGYFDFDQSYAAVRKQLSSDSFMRIASDYGAGIRILRQDAWEALCSFIISQCNNIPRIKKIISSLCKSFGERLDFGSAEHYSFPAVEKLAALDEASLAPIRCGYRAAYIISAARAVAGGAVDLAALSHTSPNEARAALKSIRGVGSKVANCTLLYGLHMLDSFPVDVWMKKAIAKYYGPAFDPGAFSPFAGIAQQYMFYYVRNNPES